ncbi:DUF1887 family protein [Clostridium sp. SHJSY1]|uniref:Card1-like endonuclease domain-containing protein n=1 Tax=Clostridium sp. SHJSY1 TaxID=2942483 RepID=UPI002874669B|nr:DUF1887 family CARF protein [Clostridium sp. SHJSY1]MDS0528143.1 DUF1887 family protein [Clostridium sp. SHJSY1]
MIFNTLVCLFDEHNEVNVLLAEKFKVRNLVFICTKYDNEIINELKNTYSKIIPNCLINFEEIKIGDINGVYSIVDRYKDALINMTGGDRLIALMLFKVASELGIRSIYVDLINKRRYILTDDFKACHEEFKDMKIKDIFELSGINIIDESSYLVDIKEIIDITNIIKSNINIWHKYKQRLYDNKIFIHDYKDNYKVIVNTNTLEKEEISLLNNSLKYLSNIKGINYQKDKEEITVDFKNDYLKGFLFKSGTWLEVLTHLVIREINEIDEVKSGVIFSWSNKAKEVRNEIDVIAIKDSVLVCISCKDSEKYDEDALNELEVYSEKLGGEDSIKILVATKKPTKITVSNRAKEMGINLIILDENIEAFKSKIQEIINKTS